MQDAKLMQVHSTGCKILVKVCMNRTVCILYFDFFPIISGGTFPSDTLFIVSKLKVCMKSHDLYLRN